MSDELKANSFTELPPVDPPGDTPPDPDPGPPKG